MGNKITFNRRLAYAGHGLSRLASEWWLGAVGGVLGWLLIKSFGLEEMFANALPANALAANTIVLLCCVAAGVGIVFLLRLLYAPIHFWLEPQGGLIASLRDKLGAQMGPFILMGVGFFAFAVFTCAGLVWLTVQVLSGTTLKSIAGTETPNTVGNPDFYLQVPEGRYKFKWDPATETRFTLRIDTERNPDFSNNPAFILRNKTNTVAYNVAAIWKSEIASSVSDLTKSPRLSKFTFDVAETKLLVMAAPGSMVIPWSYYLNDSPKQMLAVVAKEAEVYFPEQLWAVAALYFIDKMPSKVGESTAPFIARVSLNWETAEGKKRRDYRVRVTATNAKVTEAEMPVAEAFLNFSLEEIPN